MNDSQESSIKTDIQVVSSIPRKDSGFIQFDTGKLIFGAIPWKKIRATKSI